MNFVDSLLGKKEKNDFVNSLIGKKEKNVEGLGLELYTLASSLFKGTQDSVLKELAECKLPILKPLPECNISDLSRISFRMSMSLHLYCLAIALSWIDGACQSNKLTRKEHYTIHLDVINCLSNDLQAVVPHTPEELSESRYHFRTILDNYRQLFCTDFDLLRKKFPMPFHFSSSTKAILQDVFGETFDEKELVIFRDFCLAPYLVILSTEISKATISALQKRNIE